MIDLGNWAERQGDGGGGAGNMMQVEVDLAVFFPDVRLLLEGPGSHPSTDLSVSGLTLPQRSLSVLQRCSPPLVT